FRDADTHNPRPGSLRFRSATTSPVGATTNRISSPIGRTSRLTAHIRTVADFPVRGPSSSSGSAKASMRWASPCSWVCGLVQSRLPFCQMCCLGLLLFGGLGLGRRLGEFRFADPSGLDPRLHDHRFGLVAGNLDPIENSGMLGLLASVLALGPSDQIVGGA